MSLDLYFHPLASYCWKVLVALYENDIPFTPHVIDLGNEASRAKLVALWPFARFPVLHDHDRHQVVPESSIIIEHLALHTPCNVQLVPTDPKQALETRFRDRFYDVYVQDPMQKIVGDRIRPAGAKDPHGVAEAKKLLATSYDVVEAQMAGRTWAAGDGFSLADCSAAPALYYANRVLPFGDRPNTAAYLARLEARPSFARVLREAEPYFHMFPA